VGQFLVATNAAPLGGWVNSAWPTEGQFKMAKDMTAAGSRSDVGRGAGRDAGNAIACMSPVL